VRITDKQKKNKGGKMEWKKFFLNSLSVLILLLIFINFIFLFLFIRERNKTRIILQFTDELNKSLNSFVDNLSSRNLDKIYNSITQTQKNLNKILVLAKPLESKKQQLQIKRIITRFKRTNRIPFSFIYASEGENILLCEKNRKTLYLFKFSNDKLSFVKTYPCVVGLNHNDKKHPGDFATPEGIYFISEFIPGKNLSKKYGFGAFVLNYPNLLDRKEEKKGAGIWIHGHSDEKNIGEDIISTKGCIVVSNEILKELANFIKPKLTPIIIVDKMEFRSNESQKVLSKQLQNFVNSWKQAWEKIDTDKFLSFYSTDFINDEGMNYQSFKKQKERVNKTKKFIIIMVEKMGIFIPQKYGEEIAIIRFNQYYHSNNYSSQGKKLLYLKKEKEGWKIIGESSL